ncbi:hypothetical protein Hs30E_18110 [Lactococcus hodotermopsidis]|uniref:Uncharacterized protein n=1 Tax=Pseudolactococcus hodotermopsidis TaxID=2709157 RepID=A0A6A0BCW6_9LACT|nr:hypothetical protein Hs30E_18110 [Lactococcus hodotermopsidis]
MVLQSKPMRVKNNGTSNFWCFYRRFSMDLFGLRGAMFPQEEVWSRNHFFIVCFYKFGQYNSRSLSDFILKRI